MAVCEFWYPTVDYEYIKFPKTSFSFLEACGALSVALKRDNSVLNFFMISRSSRSILAVQTSGNFALQIIHFFSVYFSRYIFLKQ